MSGGGTQSSLRKALGAIKDTTTVNLAKVNSDYKVYVSVSAFQFVLELFVLLIFSFLVWIYSAGVGHQHC